MAAPWEHPDYIPYYSEEWDSLIFRFNSMQSYDTSRQERLQILETLRMLKQQLDRMHFMYYSGIQPINIAARDRLLQNQRHLEEENANLKARIEHIEALFKEPEVQDGKEFKLKPELFAFVKACKNALNGLMGNPTVVERAPPPIPVPAFSTAAYPAPVAEWSLSTGNVAQQSCRPTPFNRVQTRVAQVKDYFKSSPKPSSAAPVTQYAGPPKRRSIPRVLHQRPFRSYKDLDAAPPAAPRWDGGLYNDRDNLAAQEQQRLWAHRKFNRRTIKVGPFETYVSTAELLSKLPTTFFIASILRRPSVEYPGSEVIFLTFLSTANAAEFAHESNVQACLADTPGAQWAVVKHEIEHTKPFSPKLSDAIFDPELQATRVLVLEGLTPALFDAYEMRSQLGAVFDNKPLEDILLGTPRFFTRDALRTVYVTFCNVEEALQVWNAFNRKKAAGDPMWRCATIDFKKDPAALPELQTDDDADLIRKNAGDDDGSTSTRRSDPYDNQRCSPPVKRDPAAENDPKTTMATEEGVSGLGISLPAGGQVEEGEGSTANNDSNSNTNETASSTSASSDNRARPSGSTILIGGNAVRPGDADAITIARAMSRSRWAD